MTRPLFLEQVDERGVAWITLTREEVHNAFDDRLIDELTRALTGFDSDPRVRIVVLGAQGRSFSAGADLNWMKRMAGYGEAENLADARALAGLMARLDKLSKPTLALVQGAALGGGVGLVACCDIAIAAESAVFALTEVRLGLIPAVISPYVIAAIGSRAARRYFLTAERFSAEEAYRLGLVHDVVPSGRLQTRGKEIIEVLLAGGPVAQRQSKDLIAAVSWRPIEAAVLEDTARRIATVRVGAEAQEGMAAFFAKRKPNWTPD
jgi:methylglutaconyl-CoA hydratase